jgi:hypothetical protein
VTPLVEELPRLNPQTPGFLTSAELRFYLNVGKNEVATIAERFGVPMREGRCRERDLWRQLFELAPATDAGDALLRVQLQDINWVASRLGAAPSTIRNRIRKHAFPYPLGVQLGPQNADCAPRLRRWLPAHFEAALQGCELADLCHVPRRPISTSARDRAPLEAGADPAKRKPEKSEALNPEAFFAALGARGQPPSHPSDL